MGEAFPNRSEGRWLLFHGTFAVVCLAVLAWIPKETLGFSILGLVLFYNMALVATAVRFGEQEWILLWRFLVPLSALQVVPDWFLSAVLGVLVFPELGVPRIGTVNIFMAFMWTIALLPVVYCGLRLTARCGDTLGRPQILGAVGLASGLIFVGSEATLWRLSIWHAQDVLMVGHVAIYVVIPEIVLGIVTFVAYERVGRKGWAARLGAAAGIATLYLGMLCASFLVVEHVLGGR